jgi:hypothetical protein
MIFLKNKVIFAIQYLNQMNHINLFSLFINFQIFYFNQYLLIFSFIKVENLHPKVCTGSIGIMDSNCNYPRLNNCHFCFYLYSYMGYLRSRIV